MCVIGWKIYSSISATMSLRLKEEHNVLYVICFTIVHKINK
jgi:hypothetical protein